MTIYYSPTTKGFYDTDLVRYSVLPNELIEISKSERDNLLQEINSNNKVIVVNNGVIELQERTFTVEDVRAKRNALLSQSDYTQLPDFPDIKKTAWAAYRQLLRDLPQTYPNPKDVVWPQPPTS